MTKRAKIQAAVESKRDEDVLNDLISQVDRFVNELKNPKQTLRGTRTALKRLARSSSQWTAVKEKGIRALPSNVEQDAVELIEELSKNGIFIVPNGELESWIDNKTIQKQNWIVYALNVIHSGKVPEQLREFVKKLNTYITSNQIQQL